MISDLEREVARLRAENARLLRLLELTPRQARPPVPARTVLLVPVREPVPSVQRDELPLIASTASSVPAAGGVSGPGPLSDAGSR